MYVVSVNVKSIEQHPIWILDQNIHIPYKNVLARRSTFWLWRILGCFQVYEVRFCCFHTKNFGGAQYFFRMSICIEIAEYNEIHCVNSEHTRWGREKLRWRQQFWTSISYNNGLCWNESYQDEVIKIYVFRNEIFPNKLIEFKGHHRNGTVKLFLKKYISENEVSKHSVINTRIWWI